MNKVCCFCNAAYTTKSKFARFCPRCSEATLPVRRFLASIRKYGLDGMSWRKLIFDANFACQICGRTEFGKGSAGTLHVDHDHKTGKIRGLLCFWCNNMLGHAFDNPQILEKAAAYLQR